MQRPKQICEVIEEEFWQQKANQSSLAGLYGNLKKELTAKLPLPENSRIKPYYLNGVKCLRRPGGFR